MNNDCEQNYVYFRPFSIIFFLFHTWWIYHWIIRSRHSINRRTYVQGTKLPPYFLLLILKSRHIIFFLCTKSRVVRDEQMNIRTLSAFFVIIIQKPEQNTRLSIWNSMCTFIYLYRYFYMYTQCICLLSTNTRRGYAVE